MKAAVIDDQGRFEIDELDDPQPGPDELVLLVTACGICGSDFKAKPVMPPGTVMGHEFCGEVVAVGSAVRESWTEGTHAAVLPVRSCGRCNQCRRGDVAHCQSVRMIGLGGAAGAFAEYVTVGAELAFPLPPSVDAALGALVEPYAVGLHTARIGEISYGDDVLVIGAGPVGLTTAHWAGCLGARTVAVADPSPVRREAALAFGASVLIDPATEPVTGSYDVVVECVGKPGLLDVASGAAATHGRIVVAGVCAEPDPFFSLGALMKELSIRFSVYYRPEEFRTVIDAFDRGRIDPSGLLTRTVGLADLEDTFAALQSGPADLKVVVDPSRGPA